MSLEHWSIGYPGLAPLRELPGAPVLGLLALGVAVAVAGLAVSRLRALRSC